MDWFGIAGPEERRVSGERPDDVQQLACGRRERCPALSWGTPLSQGRQLELRLDQVVLRRLITLGELVLHQSK
jgi:hypothetical protein